MPDVPVAVPSAIALELSAGALELALVGGSLWWLLEEAMVGGSPNTSVEHVVAVPPHLVVLQITYEPLDRTYEPHRVHPDQES